MRDLDAIRREWTFQQQTPASEVIAYLVNLAKGLKEERNALRAEVLNKFPPYCICRCHIADSGCPPCGSCEKCSEGLQEERDEMELRAIGFAIAREREACRKAAAQALTESLLIGDPEGFGSRFDSIRKEKA